MEFVGSVGVIVQIILIQSLSIYEFIGVLVLVTKLDLHLLVF